MALGYIQAKNYNILSDDASGFARADIQRWVAMLKFPTEGRQKFEKAQLVNLDGTEQSAWDYLDVASHDYTILALWATWCPPCLIEIKALNDLKARLSGLPGDADVHLVSISIDQDLPTLQNKLNTLPQQPLYPVSLFPHARGQDDLVTDALGINYVPVIWVFDREGHPVGSLHLGREWSSDFDSLKSIVDGVENNNPLYVQLQAIMAADRNR